MAATSVQILGLENVLRAYENKDVVKWAIWQGRTLNEFYDGDDPEEAKQKLTAWLDLLSKYSTAIYTLKFYDDDVTKIRSNTPDMGGFNFRLYVDGVPGFEPARNPRMIGGVDTELRELVVKLNERIDKIESAEPEPADELEPWEKVLDHPIIAGVVSKMLGVSMDMGKVAGVPDSLDHSIEILRQHDPDIERHLSKLAQIATRNPQQFKMLLGMLDNF